MVRPTLWIRGSGQMVLSDVKGIIQQTTDVPAGSTLTRVRWEYQLRSLHSPNVLDWAYDMPVLGLEMLQGDDPGPVKYPIADPDEDWMWYEGVPIDYIPYVIAGAAWSEFVGPREVISRDCRAQRIATVDGPTVRWSFDQVGISPRTFRLFVTFAILFLLPA